MTNKKSVNLVLCAMFTALIIIGSYIRIPWQPVPMVLQVEFVMLAGMLLGSRWGSLSVIVFLILGLVGLPVFTNGGGIGYVFQPTFGYMIGYVLAAFVIGAITERSAKPGYARLVIANFVGIVIIYSVGLAYLYLIMNFYLDKPTSVWGVLAAGFFPTILKDAAFVSLLVCIAKRVMPEIDKLRKGNKNAAEKTC